MYMQCQRAAVLRKAPNSPFNRSIVLDETNTKRPDEQEHDVAAC